MTAQHIDSSCAHWGQVISVHGIMSLLMNAAKDPFFHLASKEDHRERLRSGFWPDKRYLTAKNDL